MNLLWQQKLCNLQQLKIAVFTYRSPFFCFPWRRPCDYHAICCVDGKTIQCLPNPSQHVPIYLYSFRVIWCLSQCISPKTQFLPHFCFPWGPPWGNHAKCCMDKKWTRCLQIVSLHVPIYLLPFLRYSEIFVKKSSFYHIPLHSTPPLGGSRRNIGTPFTTEKLEWCRYPMVKKFRRYVYSFNVIHERDGQTDGRTLHDSKDRAYASHRAVKMES